MTEYKDYKPEKRMRLLAIDIDTDECNEIPFIISLNTEDNTITAFLGGLEIFACDWDGNMKQFLERLLDYFE